jgi:predicted nucleotidyltransferase
MKLCRLSPEEYDSISKRLTEVLAQEFDIIIAYLHGSFTEKERDHFGDIDVAIFLRSDNKEEALRYEVKLEGRLQKIFPLPLVIRVLNHAPVSFCYSVIKNGHKLVDKNESLRVDFEASTLSRYFDFMPFRRNYLKDVLNLEI